MKKKKIIQSTENKKTNNILFSKNKFIPIVESIVEEYYNKLRSNVTMFWELSYPLIWILKINYKISNLSNILHKQITLFDIFESSLKTIDKDFDINLKKIKVDNNISYFDINIKQIINYIDILIDNSKYLEELNDYLIWIFQKESIPFDFLGKWIYPLLFTQKNYINSLYICCQKLKKLFEEFIKKDFSIEHLLHIKENIKFIIIETIPTHLNLIKNLEENIKEIMKIEKQNLKFIKTIIDSTENLQKIITGELNDFLGVQDEKTNIILTRAEHIKYKNIVFDTILWLKNVHIKDLKDHHHCKLWQWYDLSCKNNSSLIFIPEFIALDKIHKQLHLYWEKILEAYWIGDKDYVINLVEIWQRLSEKILVLLEKIEKQI